MTMAYDLLIKNGRLVAPACFPARRRAPPAITRIAPD